MLFLENGYEVSLFANLLQQLGERKMRRGMREYILSSRNKGLTKDQAKPCSMQDYSSRAQHQRRQLALSFPGFLSSFQDPPVSTKLAYSERCHFLFSDIFSLGAEDELPGMQSLYKTEPVHTIPDEGRE